MRLGGQTLTVINDGEPTSYDGVGDPVYGDPTLTVVPGCSVQQRSSKREVNVTDVSRARWRAFMPASAPVATTSRIVMGAFKTWPLPAGTTIYRMDGQPMIWPGRNGSVHHYECYIEEQAG